MRTIPRTRWQGAPLAWRVLRSSAHRCAAAPHPGFGSSVPSCRTSRARRLRSRRLRRSLCRSLCKGNLRLIETSLLLCTASSADAARKGYARSFSAACACRLVRRDGRLHLRRVGAVHCHECGTCFGAAHRKTCAAEHDARSESVGVGGPGGTIGTRAGARVEHLCAALSTEPRCGPYSTSRLLTALWGGQCTLAS